MACFTAKNRPVSESEHKFTIPNPPVPITLPNFQFLGGCGALNKNF
jgi:hypothetical protein